uniref:C2H2-type domain-containing protein n=1 Tax=Biomphalaria glabrata TaxID=6526 RepID=A0A2C9L011_BIOGL
MKSSRRKQTNPNKVAPGARDLDPLIMPLLPELEAPLSQKQDDLDKTDESDDGSQSPIPVTNGQNVDYELPLDMHVSLISCPNCNDSFQNQNDLHRHRLEAHGPETKKPRFEGPREDYPTAYHRLGRELLESADVPLSNGHLESPPAAPVISPPASPSRVPQPLSLKVPPQIVSPQEECDFPGPPRSPHTPPPTTPKMSKEMHGELVKSDRIFHMDAYCELCDREFCNKYFLKTHKANKHGIYEDNSPPATSVPLPFPGLMLPQDHLSPFNFKMDSLKPPPADILPPWSFKLDSVPPPKRSDSSPNIKNMEPLPMFPMPLPNLESPKPSNSSSNPRNDFNLDHSPPSSNTVTPSSNATSILTNITNSIKSGPPSSSVTSSNNDPSMEDYCHICQKHFCNKYYLKKHKQDVHGIAPENPPSTTNKRSRSSLLDLPMTSSNHMMLPQPLASLAGMHNLPGMHGLPNMHNMPNLGYMPPGVMVINPYTLPPVAIIPAGSLMPGQQLPPPPHPIISQPMNITPMPDSVLLPPSMPASSPHMNNPAGHSPNKPSPSMQDGGVHCNICAKEFCNDYYLQIHKESKHGIRKSMEESPREKQPSFVKENRNEGSRPSPNSFHNLGKNEHLFGRPRSPVERSSSVDSNYFICNICNKDFNNKYLYRIHRIHDHGLNELIDPTLVENGELLNKEDAMRNMNESLMRMAADASAVCYASSFGHPPAMKPQETVVCDICNKEMTNQYFLRLHKFNVHGIDPSNNDKYERKSLNSPIPPSSKPKTPTSSGSIPSSNLQPMNLAPHPPTKPHMIPPYLPPKLDFKDMPPFVDFGRDFKGFRDMPAFLADTINHELFARSQNHSRHMDLNFFGLPPLGKLPGEDSIKLNFDPEAYCDICKKEFCSKYFLRTHKQNIHGIKSDTTSSVSSKSSESERNNYVSPVKPSLPPSNSNGNNNSINSSNHYRSKEGSEKSLSSWRWKEPVNSSRVICDICNKEVCNKYFLRTHKQKKHGIAPSAHSPNVSMSGSPIASDCETASNASSQPDERPFRLDSSCLPQMIPLPPADRMSDKFSLKPINFSKSKDDMVLNNNIEQSETCNICSRRFKNMEWLKDHITKDHSESEALDMRSKNTSRIYTCQVCGIDFPAELSVQLHLIQEHNARVTLDTEEPLIPTEEPSLPNGEGNISKVAELSARWGLRKKSSSYSRLKKYVCSRCGFDTPWLSSLLDHERCEHGLVFDHSPSFTCKQCHQVLPSLNTLSAHLVNVHGLAIENAVNEIKNTEPEFPNTFKCSHCSAVFPTRSWGMAHVRHVHIRNRRDLPIKNSFEKTLLRCPSCPFKTHFAFRLQRHVKFRHQRSLHAGNGLSRSLSSSSPTHLGRANDVSTTCLSRLDSCVSTTAIYQSIAASLLSGPKGRSDSPLSSLERDDLILQSYNLPLGPSSIESAPFKMAAQSSAASAVIGL